MTQAQWGTEYELGGPEVLTLEEIERRTLQAIGSKRWMIRFPMPFTAYGRHPHGKIAALPTGDAQPPGAAGGQQCHRPKCD